jgi:hypothetical protein
MLSNQPEDSTELSPAAGAPPRTVAAGQRGEWGWVLVLVGVTLLAAALRFYRLGDWGFDSDEVFMRRDSIDLRPANPRPLMYLLNHYVVWPFQPLNELGLRLLPAIFGVLAVPAFYLACRRLVGARAALIGALLIAINSQLVYYSQFARYWTLVFLLSSVYPYALYVGFRDGNVRMLLLGSLTGVLAALAHPVGVLPIGGLVIWAIGSNLGRDRLRQLWDHRTVRWGALLAVVLAAAVALWFVPLLQDWIQDRDSVPQTEKGGEFLLHTPPGGRAIKLSSLLLAYVESVTVPLVLAGLLGIYVMWQGRSRPIALLLASLFFVPLAFIGLVGTRTAISIFYMVPALPVLFIGAGVFLDYLIVAGSNLRPRWLLSAVVLATIAAGGAPTLLSQYRDGRRWDFRSAARWLDERVQQGDVVFSDQPQVMRHYLKGKDVRRLVGDPTRLIETASQLRQSGSRTMWIVAPAPSHAFRTNPKLSDLNGWMYQNCQLRNTIGVGRLDFRQNFLQVYRCPPQVAPPATEQRAGSP